MNGDLLPTEIIPVVIDSIARATANAAAAGVEKLASDWVNLRRELDSIKIATSELQVAEGELRTRTFIVEEKLNLIEPQVDKIPGIESRTIRTERIVMELQREMQAAIKVLTTKQTDLQTTLVEKMDQLLREMQPHVILGPVTT